MEQIIIEKAQEKDLHQIMELLKKNQLPTEGIEEIICTTLVAKDGDLLVGCAAIELCKNTSLLRSVAVASSYRGLGIGKRLSGKAIEMSLEYQREEVYLLTETAAPFFRSMGFKEVERRGVPLEIQNSREFSSLCPQSAKVLGLFNLRNVSKDAH